MPAMLSELYDALKEAGVSEEKARKAAEAVASYDTRFATLDGKVETLRAELKGEMAWVKWMLGTEIVLTLGVLWRLLK